MSWIFTIVFSGLLFTSNQGLTTTENKPVVPDVPTTTVVKFDETDRFEQTYPLAANGKVSVSNVNGSITAEGWDRNEVKLVAIKTADTKEHLSDVEVKIDSRADSFSVETDYGSWKTGGNRWKDHGKLTVDYQLMIPRGAVLDEIETVNGSVTITNFNNLTKASAVNGTVRASNLRGNANLSTVNGEVVVDFSSLEQGSKISLGTVNGKVNLTLPSDANATLKVDSLNGNISNDFGLPVRKGKYVGRDLYGRLGTGDVRIKMDSVNGDVKILKQNDGKNATPVTNLLPQKDKDEEDWDSDSDLTDPGAAIARVDREKIRQEISRANVDAKKAIADAQQAIELAQPEIAKVTAEGLKQAAEVMKSEVVQKAMKESLRQQKVVLARMSDIAFFPSMPRVERKSDSFAVKGVPKVSVETRGCAIKVTGWDRAEVKYSVTQLTAGPAPEPVNITESHSDTAVTLNVKADDNLQRTRIEIFVPKKANLVINTDSEIRVDGISGTIDLTGEDGAINVRDSDGKLSVANGDGRIRVIGFKGEVQTTTADGSTMLEGDFDKVTARADSGEIILTLPETASATIKSRSSDTRIEGLPVGMTKQKDENREYRLGSGGHLFDLSTDGQVVLRSLNSLQELL
jgi:DUF4097 and DUF4098 domain-containing protein YvlB